MVPLERQELATEALKSFHLENLAAFELTRGLHKSVIQCSAMPQNSIFSYRGVFKNSFNYEREVRVRKQI